MRYVGEFDADDAELERVLFPNVACRAGRGVGVRFREERVVEIGFLAAAEQCELHLVAGLVVGEGDAGVKSGANGGAVDFQQHVAGLHAGLGLWGIRCHRAQEEAVAVSAVGEAEAEDGLVLGEDFRAARRGEFHREVERLPGAGEVDRGRRAFAERLDGFAECAGVLHVGRRDLRNDVTGLKPGGLRGRAGLDSRDEGCGRVAVRELDAEVAGTASGCDARLFDGRGLRGGDRAEFLQVRRRI